ncbi:MAG: hypothetical protein GXO33_03240, partial [Epsilonproteobacteria bacterium]|nr:hypothetical protein [Campylobacterota bacterium]
MTIEEAIKQLQNSILPKLSQCIPDPSHKEKFNNTMSFLLPKETLGYPDSQTFLNEKRLLPFDIALMSITYCMPDLDKKRKRQLASYFVPFASNLSLRVDKVTNQTIYKEVVLILEYVKKILVLLDEFPKYWNNYQGTKFRSSSEKNLIKAQLASLKDRLEHPCFPVTCQEEIEKTKLLINFIEMLSKPENRHIPEWIAFVNNFSSIEILHNFGLTKIELDVLKQSSNFFNGIRTQKHEVIKSVGIYIQIQISRKPLTSKDKRAYAEAIQDILEYFFKKRYPDELNRKGMCFTAKSFNKTPMIKTHLDETPLFRYQTSSRQIDPLTRCFIEFIETMTEINDDSSEEISGYIFAKNLLKE